MIAVRARRFGQRKVERAAAAPFGFGPNAATVVFHDPPHLGLGNLPDQYDFGIRRQCVVDLFGHVADVHRLAGDAACGHLDQADHPRPVGNPLERVQRDEGREVVGRPGFVEDPADAKRLVAKADFVAFAAQA